MTSHFTWHEKPADISFATIIFRWAPAHKASFGRKATNMAIMYDCNMKHCSLICHIASWLMWKKSHHSIENGEPASLLECREKNNKIERIKKIDDKIDRIRYAAMQKKTRGSPNMTKPVGGSQIRIAKPVEITRVTSLVCLSKISP